MSHYAVAVIHHPDQDYEELLAPFSENIKVPKYIHYTKQEAIEFVRKHFKDTEGKTDEECYEMIAEDYDEDMRDGKGNLYSTYNPDSKWDWYVEGGRFCDMLKRKSDGRYCDEGVIGELDFTPDEEIYKNSLRFWEVIVEHQPEKEDEEIYSSYKDTWYKDRYKTKENYARCRATFSTYAVLTPDGVWHAPGEMGWFGCSSESDEESQEWYASFTERFINSADPTDIITVVDCHI